jgi:hypothetical protein
MTGFEVNSLRIVSKFPQTDIKKLIQDQMLPEKKLARYL